MNKAIQSTDFDEVFAALKSQTITLEDVEARFVDFKTSFQRDTQAMELNERYGDDRCWANLTDAERQQVIDGCSFPVFRNPIERWIAYSMQPEFLLPLTPEMRERLGYVRVTKPLSYCIDCDGSKSSPMTSVATNALYRALWPNVPADSADTMNSFWTTYKQALRIMGLDTWTSRAKEGILAELVDDAGHLRPEFAPAPESEQAAAVQQLELLAHLTHTLGNFIPCHGPFNNGRFNATQDYWDITLAYVRDWYLHRQGVERATEAPDSSFNAGTLATCQTWLNRFGTGVAGWNAFIEQNYQQAYVGAKDEQGAYEVRPFFPGHGFDHKLPETDAELLTGVMSMNAAVIARGNRMAHALGSTPAVSLFVA